MECSRSKRIISEETDSELAANEREEFEAHMLGCRSCSKLRETLRGQSEALRSLPRLHAPANFVESVLRRVEERPPSALDRLRSMLNEFFGTHSFLKLAATAAAAIVVVVTGQMALKDGRIMEKESRSVIPVAPPSSPPLQAHGDRAPSPSAPTADSVGEVFPRKAELPELPAAPLVAPAPSEPPSAPAPSGSPSASALPEHPSASAPPGHQGNLSISGGSVAEEPQVKKKMQARMAREGTSPALRSFSEMQPEPRLESVTLTIRVQPVPPASTGITAGAPPAAKSTHQPSTTARGEARMAEKPGSLEAGPHGGAPEPETMNAPTADGKNLQARPREQMRQQISAPSATPSEHFDKVISEAKRLVRAANGEVLAEPSPELEKPLLAKVPAENYREFITGLRALGEAKFLDESSESFHPTPKSVVRVSVNFDFRR